MKKGKQPPKVVLVDDDEFLVDMYAHKFKERGVDVAAFRKGEEALAYLRQGNTPDLLVVDLVMPNVDGLTLLRAVQDMRLSPRPVIIILSNQGQEEDIEKARALGADGYLIKANAVPSEVIEMCLNHLEGRGASSVAQGHDAHLAAHR